MARIESVTRKDIFVGRLSRGSDLLEGLTAVCVERGVRLGRVSAVGAVESARIGFYNQETRQYEFTCGDRPMEIAQLTGNVSLKDGQPFVHAHVTLVDEEGQAHGGHLTSGTTVFACEFWIESFDGPVLERVLDEETGLPLWPIAD